MADAIRRGALGLLAALGLAAPASAQERAVPPHQDWYLCGVGRSDQPPRPERVACVQAAGPLATDTYDLELGGRLPPDLEARSPIGDNLIFHTDDPVHLRWVSEAGTFLFADVGGMGQAVLLVNHDYDTRTIESVDFAWQNRPLNLTEAVQKARQFEAWLAAAGFTAGPRFMLRDDYDDTPSGDQSWEAAETRLASDEAVQEMLLYSATAPNVEVSVSLSNSRRKTWAFGREAARRLPDDVPRSIYDGNGGYEWQLNVRIARPWRPLDLPDEPAVGGRP